MTARFRPSLSLEEIQYLISVSSGNREVQKKLQFIIAKVDLGIMKPAFVTAPPKEDMMTQLGETPSITPKQKRELAYIKYQHNPADCTTDEISLAKAYMYNNNMMTTKEIDEYEEQFLNMEN